MSFGLLSADPPRGEAPPGADAELRELLQEHLDAVGHAYWRTYLGTTNEMTVQEARADVVAAWTGEFGRWLHDGCIGAWDGPKLVGAVLTVQDPPWPDVPPGPFIIDLFVLPAARRRGIGRALVTTVQRQFDTRLSLRVDEAATEARALYASIGFRPLG